MTSFYAVTVPNADPAKVGVMYYSKLTVALQSYKLDPTVRVLRVSLKGVMDVTPS